MSLENFPRGEKKPEIKRSADEKKRESEEHMTEEDKQFITKNIARKRIPLLQELLYGGSICLGRVSGTCIDQHEIYLEVYLPTGFVGYVRNVDVSKLYRRLLSKEVTSKKIIQNECYPLSDLFKPGDYVVCCAKDIDKILSDPICSLSMEPQLINLNVRPNDLVKGFKIIGSVRSIEDHGYIVDTGILNVTAFLATENSEEGKQYLPNTQLLCTVKEVETVGHTTVVKLSTKEEKPVSVDDNDVVSLDVLMPGTKFSLRVKTVSYDCVKLYFGKDIFAYISQVDLKHPLSTYKPDTNVTGTLLYTKPLTKEACFSELDDTFSEKEKLRVGDIIEKAEVLCRNTSGAFFKLSESGLRGYVHFRNTKVPVEKIETVFKEGSIHKCRVLTYHWIEYIYICTTDEEVLSSIRKGDECDIVPKSASEHFVTEPPTKNEQELRRKRVSESHDVDLANPPKKALKEVPKKANDAYEMYMHMLNVHAEAWKTEFEKFNAKVIDKFSQDYQTLIECSPALQANDIDEKMKQSTRRALDSLAESCRLAESCYVDCLKKSKDINLGREAKKRALQRILPKKMKAFFMKFTNFEK